MCMNVMWVVWVVCVRECVCVCVRARMFACAGMCIIYMCVNVMPWCFSGKCV